MGQENRENPTLNETRTFLRCPICGHPAGRKRFSRGAVGHSLQALAQHFGGRGRITWRRRPMTHSELEHVSLAAAAALEIVMSELGREVEPIDPLVVLAEVLTDEEARIVGKNWIEESIKETVRREQMVEAALKRRRGIVE